MKISTLRPKLLHEIGNRPYRDRFHSHNNEQRVEAILPGKAWENNNYHLLPTYDWVTSV